MEINKKVCIGWKDRKEDGMERKEGVKERRRDNSSRCCSENTRGSIPSSFLSSQAKWLSLSMSPIYSFAKISKPPQSLFGLQGY